MLLVFTVLYNIWSESCGVPDVTHIQILSVYLICVFWDVLLRLTLFLCLDGKHFGKKANGSTFFGIGKSKSVIIGYIFVSFE